MAAEAGSYSRFRPAAVTPSGTNVSGAVQKVLSPEAVNTLQTALQNVETHGARVDGIFLRSADKNKVMQVRQAIENGRNDIIVSQDAATLAEALKIYFREMDEPLLTYGLYEDFVAAQRLSEESRVSSIRDCVGKLPKTHRDVLFHLISCLVHVASHSQENRMPAHNLGKVFGTSLLWPRVEHMLSGRLVEDTPSLDGLIETLIKNYQSIFHAEPEIESLTRRERSNSSSPVHADMVELSTKDREVLDALVRTTVDELFQGNLGEGLLAFSTVVTPLSAPRAPTEFLAEKLIPPRHSPSPVGTASPPAGKSNPSTPTALSSPVMGGTLVSATAVAKGVAPGEAAPSAQRTFSGKILDVQHGSKHNNEIHAAGWIRIMKRIGLKRDSVPTLERRPLIAYCKRIRNEIRSFDKDFSAQNGRYPNSSERQPVRELHANYQQLKRLVREHAATQIQSVYRGSQTRKTMYPFGRGSPSDLDSNDGKSDPSKKKLPRPTEEYESGSQSIDQLTTDELKELKRRIREKLKAYDTEFEKMHGRPATKTDKEVMRPLYKRYNEVKMKLENSKGGSGSEKSPPSQSSKVPPVSPKPGATAANPQLEALREAKRKLQKKLYKFEMDFTRQHGRKIKTPEDVRPVIDDYKRYKAIKVELEAMERAV